MKKLLTLFSFLAFFSLIFIGCQTAEDVIGPDDLSKPGNPVWSLPTAVNLDNGATDVDLVAGQNNVVGHITILNDGVNIYVTYNTIAGWVITETHLDAAYQPQFIPQNKKGNPTFGLFRYGGTGLNVNSAGPYTIPIADLMGTNTGNMVYVAAHAVVESATAFCPDFPEGVILEQPDFADRSIRDGYYFPGSILHFPNGSTITVNGWCADVTSSAPYGRSIPVEFFCIYDDYGNVTPPSNLSCWLDPGKEGNICKVNWIINNRNLFEGLTWKEIQVAIWMLVDNSDAYPMSYIGGYNEDLVEALIEAANAYESEFGCFVPACGQLAIVIMYESGPECRQGAQPYFIEWPVGCGDETAMAFNYDLVNGPDDITSKLFPGHVWFRYFGYQL
jgi:hypothetical protein